MKTKTLALLCAITALLSPATFAQNGAPVEIEKLKALLAEQQRQIETLRQAVAEQQKTIDTIAKPRAQAAAPAMAPLVASSTPMAVPGAAASPSPKLGAPPLPQPEAPSPLQVKVGDVSVIPIGFMDATAVWRDKNAASSIGTNFASVPYNNVTAGHLSEFRFSPQNSRLGLRADVNVHGAHVIGYNEFDFLGTSGGNNLGVTNGAFVPRLRLFWVDVRKNKWEILGGQSWTMLTPNRKQISAMPGDLFYSQVVDVN